MSLLFRAVRASSSSIAPATRALSTAPVVRAPGGKEIAKGAGGMVRKLTKKQQKAKENVASKASGGGGSAKSRSVSLSSSLAREKAPLDDLVQLYPESIVPLNLGKAALFPRNTFDQLQVFGLPRKLAKDLADGSPASIIRQETLDLVKTLSSGKSSSSKDARYIMTGHRGSGLSTLLVQAVSYAIESGWIVLYVPEARRWIDSSEPYAYDEKSMTFHQSALAASLLSKLHAVNRDRLKSLKLSADVELDGNNKFSAGGRLDDVVALGAKDSRVAVKALEVTMSELSKQTQFPVLFAVDDAQCLFQTSKYRQPDYSVVESYNLSTPRLALEYFTGTKEFAKGVVLGAVSQTLDGSVQLPTVELHSGLGIQTRRPVTPYSKLQEYHLKNASSGIKPIELPFGMNGTDAAGMFELWVRKGWIVNGSDDVFLSGLEAAQGNPLELARSWQLSHMAHIA